jgi:hypothetical protein
MHVLSIEAPGATEYLPATQAMQMLSVEAAITTEYLPAPQGVQSEAPVAEYLPAAQLVHSETELAPALFENFPARHWTQVEAAMAPTSLEYLPVLHFVHFIFPDTIQLAVKPALDSIESVEKVTLRKPVVDDKVLGIMFPEWCRISVGFEHDASLHT